MGLACPIVSPPAAAGRADPDSARSLAARFNPAVTLSAATQGVLPWRECVPISRSKSWEPFPESSAAHLMFGEPLFFPR